MARPLNNFEFATDTNYATGPDAGTPTKVAPSAGEIDSGFVRGTAAVAQHMNFLMGSIQEWLTYVAGLASDTEFLGDLEARAWDFDNTVHVDGAFTTSSTATIGGTLTANGAAHVLGSLDVDTDVNVDGNLVLDGTALLSGNVTLGGTLTMPTRTVAKTIDIPFSPGYFNNAGVFEPQGYLGGGTGGRGFHFWGDDLGGNYFRPVLIFTVPRGSTLIGGIVCGRRAVSGSTNVDFKLSLLAGTGTGNTATTKATAAFSSSTGSNQTFTIAAPDRVVTDQWTTYEIELTPSQGSTPGDPDLISFIQVSYSSTHADENV